MSRIGQKPIIIESGVTVTVQGDQVRVVGPKGELALTLRPEISAKVTENIIDVKISKPAKNAGAYMGMTRALIGNMVKGVSQGFEKKLELVGVGYRAKMNSADSIGLTVGFSHPVEFKLPAGIHAEVADNQIITITGIDRNLVGQVAANIRKIRKPEPYKGKGIKYAGEVIKRKQGKSGKI